jgi:hypothetical protein
MGDCTHDFVSRATKLQNGECYSCLRARLEETERERDALRLALVEVTDQHAKRRGEVLAAQMVEKAAQDRAEAAEAALKKIASYDECEPGGHAPLSDCVCCMAKAALSPEPLRTEGAPKQGKCYGDCVCERHMLIINEKEAELRARVERLEKVATLAQEARGVSAVPTSRRPGPGSARGEGGGGVRAWERKALQQFSAKLREYESAGWLSRQAREAFKAVAMDLDCILTECTCHGTKARRPTPTKGGEG